MSQHKLSIPHTSPLQKSSSLRAKYAREGMDNSILDAVERIHAITSRGLAPHLCRFFHDTLVQISDLDAVGKSHRENLVDPTSLVAFPTLCKPGEKGLGCAHDGGEERITPSADRSVNSTQRMQIIKGIQLLMKYWPEKMGNEHGVDLVGQIRNVGLWIATNDVKINRNSYDPKIVASIQAEHSEKVEWLFHLAVEIEQLLIQALEEGKGYETAMKKKHDPFAELDE